MARNRSTPGAAGAHGADTELTSRAGFFSEGEGKPSKTRAPALTRAMLDCLRELERGPLWPRGRYWLRGAGAERFANALIQGFRREGLVTYHWASPVRVVLTAAGHAVLRQRLGEPARRVRRHG